MKKTQVALAALALVASAAVMADGVSVSGRIDMGFQSGSGSADVGANSGGSAGRGLTDSLLAPNLLNFTGSEDLGNGMKASFNVWTTFTPSNIGGGFVFLQQNVGLSGDFGTIRVGQTVDSFWGNGLGNFDVTAGGNMGSVVTASFMHGASGVFHDNTIQYVAPSVSGVNAAVTYVLDTGSTARSSASLQRGSYSAAATTDVAGIKLGAGYSSNLNADGDANKSYFVGAGTDFGIAKVNAYYLSSNLATGLAGSAGKANTMGVNASAPLVAGLIGTAGYFTTDGSAINGTNTSVGVLYPLSKRTTLFGNYEKATDLTILGLGQGGAGQGTAGSIFTLGVAHSF